MAANNSCRFYGRLTKDVELRTIQQTGMYVANLNLAVDAHSKDNSASADFINLTAFGKTAETLNKFFHKGSRILVESHVKTSNYVDKNTQKKVYRTDFIVDGFQFIDTKAESGNSGASQQTQEEQKGIPGNDFVSADDLGIGDELPFA